VNEGWINRRYITIAQNGWQGLAAKVTADGQVQDISASALLLKMTSVIIITARRLQRHTRASELS